MREPASPKDQTAGLLAEGACNMLYPAAHADKTGIGAIDMSVRSAGNWVGGTFACYPDQLVFQMNLLNEPFQKTPHGRLIRYDWIEAVRPGRMFLFAETVDIHSCYGLFRIRTSARHRKALYQLLPNVQL